MPKREWLFLECKVCAENVVKDWHYKVHPEDEEMLEEKRFKLCEHCTAEIESLKHNQ